VSKSLQGHFLIAAPTLVDPNFFRAVVLMVQHNDEGALGLILNRPTRASVAEICEKVLEEPESPIGGNVCQGGPCEGPLMILHDEEAAGDVLVSPGVHFTTDKTKLEWLLRQHDGKATVFVGYSGWSAGQLEQELKGNSWLLLPASAGEVFDPSIDWQKLLTRAFVVQYVPAERIPDDPSVN
jgi:putative transcriptional regulator